MKIAYADPPYIGQAKKHYSHDERCAEVNHEVLIQHLQEFDGWALSLSSPSLRQILPLCPPEVRVGAWVKPFCAFKKHVTVAYAWEPVIFVPARKRPVEQPTVRDWVSANITLKRGLTGVKPDEFCFWLFEALGCQKGDDLHDIFPGSGAVAAAWERWNNRLL